MPQISPPPNSNLFLSVLHQTKALYNFHKRGQGPKVGHPKHMRNIFLEKSYTKCGEKTIPRHFYKKSKLSISLDQQAKVFFFHCMLGIKLKAIEIY